MLAVNNYINQEKTTPNFNSLQNLELGKLIKRNEILQSKEQMTRRGNKFYKPQISQISKALIGG